jgi:hypothetical protein
LPFLSSYNKSVDETHYWNALTRQEKKEMNTNRYRWIALIGLVAIVALLAAGCAPAPATPMAQEGAAGERAVEMEQAPMEPAAAEPIGGLDDTSADGAEAGLPPVQDANQPVGQGQDRLIIKNGEMDLLVEDTDRALGQISQIAVDNGGYVLNSQTWQTGEVKAGTITIAVRAENFETAMRRLGDTAIEVLRETSSGQDVTSEYVDLRSRLDNLEATRDRLRTFLDDAQDVDEALAVNRELSQIEAEIEQVQGRMNYLSGRAAYSTIAINLSMPYDIPTPTPTPWALGRTFNSAVKAQGALLRFLADAATWLVIVFGPYLVVLAIIILIVRALMRRRKKSGSS